MNNTCSAAVTDSAKVKMIKTILLSFVMVTALLGNIFIIATVIKIKTMRRTTNFFIANMAASDMFIAAVVIPRLLTELHVGSWRWLIDGALGVITCKICFFLADFSICISILSHAVIAIDRFWAVVYSLRPSPITAARRKYIIALIWLFSFVLHSPNFYSYRLHTFQGLTFCRRNWAPLDDVASQKIYYGVIFATVLCIPVLLMTVLYTWLIVSLLTRKGFSEQPLPQRQRRRKEDIKVLRKVVILLVAFLISLTPITVFALLAYYSWDTRTPCDKWNHAFIVHFIFLSNSAINPCLCIFLSESYRNCIKKLLYFSTARFKERKSRCMTQHTIVNNDNPSTPAVNEVHHELDEFLKTNNNAA